MKFAVGLALASLFVWGCSSDGLVHHESQAIATGAETASWSHLYAAYFGPQTPGHCGNAGCHADASRVFRCGGTKDECYAGLLAAGLINPDDPPRSLLGDAERSPLLWVVAHEPAGHTIQAPAGDMPKDALAPNDEAAMAVKSWLEGGARND